MTNDLCIVYLSAAAIAHLCKALCTSSACQNSTQPPFPTHCAGIISCNVQMIASQAAISCTRASTQNVSSGAAGSYAWRCRQEQLPQPKRPRRMLLALTVPSCISLGGTKESGNRGLLRRYHSEAMCRGSSAKLSSSRWTARRKERSLGRQGWKTGLGSG